MLKNFNNTVLTVNSNTDKQENKEIQHTVTMKKMSTSDKVPRCHFCLTEMKTLTEVPNQSSNIAVYFDRNKTTLVELPANEVDELCETIELKYYPKSFKSFTIANKTLNSKNHINCIFCLSKIKQTSPPEDYTCSRYKSNIY